MGGVVKEIVVCRSLGKLELPVKSLHTLSCCVNEPEGSPGKVSANAGIAITAAANMTHARNRAVTRVLSLNIRLSPLSVLVAVD